MTTKWFSNMLNGIYNEEEINHLYMDACSAHIWSSAHIISPAILVWTPNWSIDKCIL